MHELAIAESIAAIAERHAGGRRVRAVSVKAGRLRQVVPSALEFAFEIVTRGTPLEGARVEIESIPAVVRCAACGLDTIVAEFPLCCSRCGSTAPQVVRGEELFVDSLELEDATFEEDEEERRCEALPNRRHSS